MTLLASYSGKQSVELCNCVKPVKSREWTETGVCVYLVGTVLVSSKLCIISVQFSDVYIYIDLKLHRLLRWCNCSLGSATQSPY